MLNKHQNQPIDLGTPEDDIPEDTKIYESISDFTIKSKRIGDAFDNTQKISLDIRLGRIKHKIKSTYSHFKYTIRNHYKWHKAMKYIRPWEGFSGLTYVMQTHLKDYIEQEEKYGNTVCKDKKITTAKETVEILSRMEPQSYWEKHYYEVIEKYPDYKSFIIEYENGVISDCGEFIEQGSGWAGHGDIYDNGECQKGYFELIDGEIRLADSPDQSETDRLLEELEHYKEERGNTHKLAEADSEKDFERLFELLKENLYSWWD